MTCTQIFETGPKYFFIAKLVWVCVQLGGASWLCRGVYCLYEAI